MAEEDKSGSSSVVLTGRQILGLYEKAKKAVENAHAMAGGELGGYLRGTYDIGGDGCSVCSFKEKGICLSYGADCCGTPWKMNKFVWLPKDSDRPTPIDKIDPNATYDIPKRFSVAEQFNRGILKPECFMVRDYGGQRECFRNWYDTFEEADRQAQRVAQENIERLKRDPVWRCYTASGVRDDVQRARERYELRHYEYYVYDRRYRYWVSVEPASRSDYWVAGGSFNKGKKS